MDGQNRGSRGFTLLELIVVVGVVAVLTLMAVPALMSIVPSAQLRGSARGLANLMQQARLLAENTQKPARLSLDCRPAGTPCRVRLDTAVFKPDGTLDSWASVSGSGREMGRTVRVTADESNPPGGIFSKVSDNPAGLFWAVFLPTGQVRASHDPLRLVFSAAGSGVRRWELALNKASGRATLRGQQ